MALHPFFTHTPTHIAEATHMQHGIVIHMGAGRFTVTYTSEGRSQDLAAILKEAKPGARRDILGLTATEVCSKAGIRNTPRTPLPRLPAPTAQRM